MRDEIAKHRVDYTAFQWLHEEKAIVEAKLRDLKVAYTLLKDAMQDVTFCLGSTRQQLCKSCSEINSLN